MLKELKALFKVRDFCFHFVISSLVYLFLPNLIFKIYPPHSNEYLLHGHSWLLNFDGIHYFNNEYQYEANHAFFLYVKFVQLFKNLLGGYFSIAFLMLINKLAFLLAASDLNVILRILFEKQGYMLVNGKQSEQNKEDKSQSLVRIGLLFFIYNPAGIFFNVVYTESLFCFVSFKAVKYLLQNRSTSISTILMTLAVGIRSNGMFMAPAIGLQILVQFFQNLKSNLFGSLKALVKGIIIIVALVLPLVLHNFFTYYNLCQSGNHQSDLCKGSWYKGSWFGFYGLVSDRYWSVGFLRYFNLRNIIFIIIGAPAVIVGGLGLSYFSNSFNLRKKGLYLSFLVLFMITTFFTNIQSSTRFFCGHPYFYYIMTRLSMKLKVVRVWALFYWLIGIFMYVVGFPWT